MNFIPKSNTKMPNYWCTWSAQNMIVKFEEMQEEIKTYEGDKESLLGRQNINEKTLLKEPGWAVNYFDKIRADLYLVIDDGWDVPYRAHSNDERWKFGSFEVNEDRFPSMKGNPQERLKALNERVKELGWVGLGIWIAAQAVGEKADNLFNAEEIEAYFRERAKWCRFAGVKYWKVDWGFRENSVEFREMLTKVAAEEYPELTVEHSTPMPPINNYASKDGRFADWNDYLERSRQLLSDTKVIRTYDVLPHFSVPTTLDRVSELLKCGNQLGKSSCVLNVEDEIYLAASLGCLTGVMRSSCCDGKEVDFIDYTNCNKRIVEAVRALRWQRLSPAFDVSANENHISSEILNDSWVYKKGEVWLEEVLDKEIVQGAPAVVSRGIKLPIVTSDGVKPFITASKNPTTGAVSVSTLPRIVNGIIDIPLANVEMELEDISCPVGVFGNFLSLTINCSKIAINQKVWLQDMASDEAADVTDKIIIENGRVTIPGQLITDACMQENGTEDVSYPGVVICILE